MEIYHHKYFTLHLNSDENTTMTMSLRSFLHFLFSSWACTTLIHIIIIAIINPLPPPFRLHHIKSSSAPKKQPGRDITHLEVPCEDWEWNYKWNYLTTEHTVKEKDGFHYLHYVCCFIFSSLSFFPQLSCYCVFLVERKQVVFFCFSS